MANEKLSERIILRLNPQDQFMFQEIFRLTPSSHMNEVFRRALKRYYEDVKFLTEGGQIIHRNARGKETIKLL